MEDSYGQVIASRKIKGKKETNKPNLAKRIEFK